MQRRSLRNSSIRKKNLKVVLDGPITAGKSVFLHRLISDEFLIMRPTVGFNIRRKPYTLDGIAFDVTIIDLCGVWDKNEHLPYHYLFREADVVIEFFDISNPIPAQLITPRVVTFHKAFQKPVLLVGLKSDLRQNLEYKDFLFPQKFGSCLAHLLGAENYMECSAKSNQGVMEVFEAAIRTSFEKGYCGIVDDELKRLILSRSKIPMNENWKSIIEKIVQTTIYPTLDPMLRKQLQSIDSKFLEVLSDDSNNVVSCADFLYCRTLDIDTFRLVNYNFDLDYIRVKYAKASSILCCSDKLSTVTESENVIDLARCAAVTKGNISLRFTKIDCLDINNFLGSLGSIHVQSMVIVSCTGTLKLEFLSTLGGLENLIVIDTAFDLSKLSFSSKVISSLKSLILNECHTDSPEIPAVIGVLSQLEVLDVTCRSFRILPESLSLLDNLHTLRCNNDQLIFPPKNVLQKSAQEILQYLKAFHDEPFTRTTYREAKMMVLGQEGVGKSTLVKSLKRNFWIFNTNPPSKTEGVDISVLQLQNYDCKVYDLAGDVEYLNTHALFFSPNCLHLAVFDLSHFIVSKGIRSIDLFSRLELWLQTIACQDPHSYGIIVGTHMDHRMLSPEVLARLRENLGNLLERYRPLHLATLDKVDECLLCNRFSDDPKQGILRASTETIDIDSEETNNNQPGTTDITTKQGNDNRLGATGDTLPKVTNSTQPKVKDIIPIETTANRLEITGTFPEESKNKQSDETIEVRPKECTDDGPTQTGILSRQAHGNRPDENDVLRLNVNLNRLEATGILPEDVHKGHGSTGIRPEEDKGHQLEESGIPLHKKTNDNGPGTTRIVNKESSENQSSKHDVLSEETDGQPSIPHILGIYEVSGITNKNVKRLKRQLQSSIQKIKKYTNTEKIPQKWLDFRDSVKTKLSQSEDLAKQPIFKLLQVYDLAYESQIYNHGAISAMLRFFHSQGDFLWYEDISEMKDVVILDPQWLSNQLRTLVSHLPHVNAICEGVLHHSKLPEIWSGTSEENRSRLIHLFRNVGLCFNVSKMEDLFPCKLPVGWPDREMWPSLPKPDERQTSLLFAFSFLSPSFFPDLIVVINEKRATFPSNVQPLYYRFNVVYITKAEGSCPRHNEKRLIDTAGEMSSFSGNKKRLVSHRIHFELMPYKNMMKVTIRGSRPCCMIPDIETTIEEVTSRRYPGMTYNERVVCPECEMKKLHSPSTLDLDDSHEGFCHKGHQVGSIENVLSGRMSSSDLIPSAITQAVRTVGEVLDDHFCPKLFAVLPINVSSLSIKERFVYSYLRDGYAVHLLCESPEEWHFVSSPGFRVGKPKTFFQTYGKRVCKLLRVISALGAPFKIASAVDPHCKIGVAAADGADKMCKELKALLDDYLVKYPHLKSSLGSPNDDLKDLKSSSGLRRSELSRFLEVVAKGRDFGPLTCTYVDKCDEWLWLCEKHSQKYAIVER